MIEEGKCVNLVNNYGSSSGMNRRFIFSEKVNTITCLVSHITEILKCGYSTTYSRFIYENFLTVKKIKSR